MLVSECKAWRARQPRRKVKFTCCQHALRLPPLTPIQIHITCSHFDYFSVPDSSLKESRVKGKVGDNLTR